MSVRYVFNKYSLLMFTLVFGSACMPEIAPTNPYDPATPIEQQKKATLTLSVFATATDTNDPQPLQDAEVIIADGTSQLGSSLKTEPDGQIEWVDLVPGT